MEKWRTRGAIDQVEECVQSDGRGNGKVKGRTLLYVHTRALTHDQREKKGVCKCMSEP